MAKQTKQPIDLIRIAKKQKALLWLILLMILSTPLLVAMVSLGLNTVPELVFLGIMIIVLVIQVLSIVQAFRLTIEVRANLVWPSIMILGLLIPMLSLIMLLIINSKANSLLKYAGIRVGIMGVPKSEYTKLMGGCCRMCGYSRAGLAERGACPECGCVPSDAPVFRAS